ncbi:hypothetical protein EMCRGX_G012659 [Ephydatia muelleri]
MALRENACPEPDSLRSFSKLTGAGPTGLRIQHFIDAADVPLSCLILQSLKGVVNILVAGRAPPMIASFLAGGNLTALHEDSPPGGPPDPESDTNDIVISVFINKIINPAKSFGSSDPCASFYNSPLC